MNPSTKIKSETFEKLKSTVNAIWAIRYSGSNSRFKYLPTQAELAYKSGVSERTVKRHWQDLKKEFNQK